LKININKNRAKKEARLAAGLRRGRRGYLPFRWRSTISTKWGIG
jgi:hypothetical protein